MSQLVHNLAWPASWLTARQICPCLIPDQLLLLAVDANPHNKFHLHSLNKYPANLPTYCLDATLQIICGLWKMESLFGSLIPFHNLTEHQVPTPCFVATEQIT